MKSFGHKVSSRSSKKVETIHIAGLRNEEVLCIIWDEVTEAEDVEESWHTPPEGVSENNERKIKEICVTT